MHGAFARSRRRGKRPLAGRDSHVDPAVTGGVCRGSGGRGHRPRRRLVRCLGVLARTVRGSRRGVGSGGGDTSGHDQRQCRQHGRETSVHPAHPPKDRQISERSQSKARPAGGVPVRKPHSPGCYPSGPVGWCEVSSAAKTGTAWRVLLEGRRSCDVSRWVRQRRECERPALPTAPYAGIEGALRTCRPLPTASRAIRFPPSASPRACLTIPGTAP